MKTLMPVATVPCRLWVTEQTFHCIRVLVAVVFAGNGYEEA